MNSKFASPALAPIVGYLDGIRKLAELYPSKFNLRSVVNTKRRIDGRTPLHVLCRLGLDSHDGAKIPAPNEELLVAVVSALISSGADIEARTKREVTPLLDAMASAACPRVVEMLLTHGADANVSCKGRRPFCGSNFRREKIREVLEKFRATVGEGLPPSLEE